MTSPAPLRWYTSAELRQIARLTPNGVLVVDVGELEERFNGGGAQRVGGER